MLPLLSLHIYSYFIIENVCIHKNVFGPNDKQGNHLMFCSFLSGGLTQ